MFKQIKSIVFWTLLYKFRKRVTIIAILIAMILFAQWIYSDIVEYLTLTEKLEYLNYLLIGKWLMIFTNFGISLYLILTMFKPSNEKQKELEIKKEVSKKTTSKEFSNREKELLNKKLRSKADILMDK